jgi:hypothetical protein
VGWRIEEERKSKWFVVMTNIKAENTQNTCAFDRKEQLTSLWCHGNFEVEVWQLNRVVEIIIE